MILAETQKQLSWFIKFSLCFLAFVGSANLALFVILPILPFYLSKYIMSVGLLTLVFAVLFSLGFSIYWHLKEKKGTVNSEKYRIWLTTILRYWIAFHITIFGFEKILGVNFASSYHIDDALLGTLSGQELTWKYYGYSFGLTLIISSFQIIGSFLLLFRRTVLLGVAVLLPVMLNIVLINLFYGIGPITALTSIIICILSSKRKLERYKGTILM